MKNLNLLRTFITISIALGIGIFVIAITSSEPANAISSFFIGPFSSAYFFGNMLAASIPLMLTGLAASIAFSASAFNLGLEGQLYIGALVGTYITWKFQALSPLLLIPLVLVISFLAGGIIAAFSGYLKVKRNVNELISSFLISYTLVYIGDFFLEGPFKDPLAGLAASPYFDSKLMFSKVLKPSDLHAGVFIAAGIIFIVYFMMKKSTLGFEITMTGKNRIFSQYAGMPVSRVTVIAMLMSGGFAGLAGIIDIYGIHGRMIRGYSAGYGWNGIAVALIARNHPLLVIPAAIFFAYLESGANVGSLFSDITPELARIIQAAVFYLITAEGLFSFMKARKEAVSNG
ncbi:ABC transporter permease [Kosmotoga arenicorallina S304]|uniref:ABC transporter permease n=1 Tax=Kosmotoga arenicorallina S304 TaxID=1453497 RepID=A0A176JSX4_9BACT|nr:ABC transporter permease [Kosmotoga arenicorallina]OAA26334.1 ABC transporter permease [Kosmotoga arenicorallina S304]